MTKDEKQKVLDVLNDLEVVEQNGGEDAYILVANNEENRKKLNKVGVSDKVINQYGDEETFCILTLAFSEGYADLFDKGKFVVFDKKFEVEVNNESVVLYKDNNEVHLAVSPFGGNVITRKLTEEDIQKIKEVLS